MYLYFCFLVYEYLEIFCYSFVVNYFCDGRSCVP
jgi:hypothetical protein